MDFGKSFSYVFKDPDWFKKIGLVALCSLIPIIGSFILVGWALEATKNVIEGNSDNALPALEFGKNLGKGFMATLIAMIYSIPIALLTGIASAAFSFAPQSEDALRIILFILGGCVGLVGLVLGILVGFLSTVAIANFVAKGEFGAAFRFKELFGMLKKSFGSWLLVLLGSILALGIIGPLGTVVCFIGVFLTMAYGYAIYGHLLGQAYNKSVTPVIETL